MSTIVKLKDVNLVRLNNAEFTEFMNRFRALVPALGEEEEERPGGLSVLAATEITDYGLTAEMTEAFDADMQALTDAVSRSQVDENTKPRAELDAARDAYISYYFSQLSAARKSPFVETSGPAETLWTRTKDYRGIQRLPLQQETAQVRGLLFDLDKAENQPLVAALHLETLVEKLREANEEFAALSGESLATRAADLTEETKAVRTRLIERYDEISTTLFAYSVLFKDDVSLTFVRQLNSLIDETATAYKRRGKGETPSEEEETPDGGEERPGEL